MHGLNGGRWRSDRSSDRAHRSASGLPHPDNPYSAWCIGLGFNLLSGNYEVGTMLVIHDPQFWEAFEHQLRPNWEVDHLMPVTTARPGQHNEEFEAAALLDVPEVLEPGRAKGSSFLRRGLLD